MAKQRTAINTYGGYLILRKKPKEKIYPLNLYFTIQEITGGLGFLDYPVVAFQLDGRMPQFDDTENGLRSHLFLMERRIYERKM